MSGDSGDERHTRAKEDSKTTCLGQSRFGDLLRLECDEQPDKKEGKDGQVDKLHHLAPGNERNTSHGIARCLTQITTNGYSWALKGFSLYLAYTV